MKQLTTQSKILTLASLGLMSAIMLTAAGCGSGPAPAAQTPTAAALPPPVLNLSAPAGIQIVAPTDAKNQQLLALAHQVRFSTRTDPFALTSSEQSFDSMQASMSLVSQNGDMEYMGPDAPAPKMPPQVQQQPYRRLSGVCIGNAVYAILDTGNGSPQIIYPGAKVKGTDWTVVSIDMDKATLTRPGNVLPKTITVRLEQAPPGTGPSAGNAAGGPAAGGPAAGGRPGGLPGVPNGPGGRRGGTSGPGAAGLPG